VNAPLKELLCSGVSQRRAAMILNVHRKTIVRKFRFLAMQAKTKNLSYLTKLRMEKINYFQFDEMETSEHSKLKLLSIIVAVNPNDRRILFAEVAQMPSNGLLARKSRLRYGTRKDYRPQKLEEVFAQLSQITNPNVNIRSDMNPRYLPKVKKYFDTRFYSQIKGRRGCVVGQGELKGGGFDPLFNLNHNCAMIRANLNRLFRRTWCTTKKGSELQKHLDLYLDYHNSILV
jgi:hypothetical protein